LTSAILDFLLGLSAMAQQNIGDDGSGENQQQKHSYRFEFHDALRRRASVPLHPLTVLMR
jgi:hypothetical protein